MAELNSPKQQPVTVSADQEEQLRKGDDYERRAANEVNGWGMFCGDYDKAIQFLEKACSFYKPSKAFDKVAGAQMKIARCHLKLGNVEEGASTYVAAAKHYKKTHNRGEVTCLSRAAMLFEEIGQLSAAGRYYQELGDISDTEGKMSESIENFRKAAELYLANESLVLSNQCRTKVAKQAAELERYTEAIPIFEALAKEAVNTGASKKTAKEMFLHAGLCYLCSFDGDGAAVKQALKRFQEVEPNFTTSRESKIILIPTCILAEVGKGVIVEDIPRRAMYHLATAFEERNKNLYTEVLNTHEVLFRSDALARMLANRSQKQLNSLPAKTKKTKQHPAQVQQQPNQPMDGLRLDELATEST